MSSSRNLVLWRSSHPWICERIINDTEEFSSGTDVNFFFHNGQSFVRSNDPTRHGLIPRTFDFVDILLECHSLFLSETNIHFCLQEFQELFKSVVNDETIKIVSHPEMTSYQISENGNQSRSTEVMMIWSRSSFVHEDIKLIVIKKFYISIPRGQSRDIGRWLDFTPRYIRSVIAALILVLLSPMIMTIPSSIVVQSSLWICYLCRPSDSFWRIFVEKNFLNTWRVLIKDSRLFNHLNNSSKRAYTRSICPQSPLTSEQT